jgi:hypothetical protein
MSRAIDARRNGIASHVPSLSIRGKSGPSIAASSASGINTNRVPMMSIVVRVIKPFPMPDPFYNHIVSSQPELHAEIPGSQAIPSGEFPSQRFCATYVRPLLQSFEQDIYPCSNRLWQSGDLCSGCCRKPNHCSIMAFYDKKVKTTANRFGAHGLCPGIRARASSTG